MSKPRMCWFKHDAYAIVVVRHSMARNLPIERPWRTSLCAQHLLRENNGYHYATPIKWLAEGPLISKLKERFQ